MFSLFWRSKRCKQRTDDGELRDERADIELSSEWSNEDSQVEKER